MSKLEEEFAIHLKALKVPAPIRQFRYLPKRKCQADFAWPEYKLIVEIQGGTWINGGHSRGTGYAKDCLKYNAAQLLGWKVLCFTCDHIKNGIAAQTINNFFKAF